MNTDEATPRFPSALDGDSFVIDCAGASLYQEVDHYKNPPKDCIELRKQMIDAINDPQVGRLVVDLSSVEIVDTTGLGTLIGGLKRARAKEKQFALRLGTTEEQKSLHKVFRITGLYKVFEIEETDKANPE